MKLCFMHLKEFEPLLAIHFLVCSNIIHLVEYTILNISDSKL